MLVSRAAGIWFRRLAVFGAKMVVDAGISGANCPRFGHWATSREEAVGRRLEAELEELQSGAGGVRLPEE
jgi:hypothetical protein